jgi:hypothetical protein
VHAGGAQAPDGHITAPAVITEVVYAGSTTRVVAAPRSGGTVNAVLLNDSPANAADLTRGTDVLLSWPPSALRPLAA